MNFQNIKTVEQPDIYVQKALRASKKGRKIRCKDKSKQLKLEELQRVQIYKNTLYDELQKIIKGFPSFEDLNPFYKELIDSQISVDNLRVEISKLSWMRQKIIHLFKDYHGRMKGTESFIKVKKFQREFYGRTSSLLKSSKKTFDFLEKSRKVMKGFPSIKTKMKTICIVGFPNVGKSTLLKNLTGADVPIEPYAFTTKSLLIGYIDKDIQVIDTPGTLNRYNKMNNIEKQAYLAIKHLAEKIVYVFDPSETCGYEVDKQIELLKYLEKEFNDKEIIIFISKIDIIGEEKINPFIQRFESERIFYDVAKLKEYITT